MAGTFGLLAVALWAGGGSEATAQPAVLRWRGEGAATMVEVTGIVRDGLPPAAPFEPGDRRWAARLAVFAEQPGAAGQVMPPMAGEWRIEGDTLRFIPRFPLTRGVRYRAEYRSAAGALTTAHYELPADQTPPGTEVVQVFPTGAELPENQLKFYVHFSAPMSRSGVYEHIRLKEASGRALELPFLELDEELWDPSMTRLTLFIDPGRIKRGVRPLLEAGPVFVAGQSYVLEIAATCRDAAGRPLRATYAKTFRIGAADRVTPEPMRWKISPPAAGTREALKVEFDEALDHALALRLIAVAAGEGTRVAVEGEASLQRQERDWNFVPDRPWARGVHRLLVATTIEDLAGNNIGQAFDVDRFERVNRRVATETVTVAFEVR
jgi:hypothetical protein